MSTLKGLKYNEQKTRDSITTGIKGRGPRGDKMQAQRIVWALEGTKTQTHNGLNAP